MKKPAIEVLPSKEQLALDRLTQAVLQNIAAKEADKPETDEELSESVLMQPWCLPRDVSQAIRRMIPVWHSEKHALVYAENGCFKCERKDVPHQSLGLCLRCYGLYVSRLKAAIVKQADKNGGRPNVGQMKAALTLKSDSARNILAEIVALPDSPVNALERMPHASSGRFGGKVEKTKLVALRGALVKPTKRLGRPRLGNSRGTGR
jgi:hypothetical protein